MSSVYSGGLLYEYSQEQSRYGLVKIVGDQVEELEDFKTYKNALAEAKAPSGDGGYKSSGEASKCPAKTEGWEVGDEALPAIPEQAKHYMEHGAGKGAGLSGPGSQNAGSGSPGKATPGSGQAPTPTHTKNAAAGQVPESLAPFVCGLVVLISTVFGTMLL